MMPDINNDSSGKAANNQRFYDIVWPMRAMVLRSAQFLTHSVADAEELAQESLIKAWRSLDQFTGSDGQLTAWLLTILRHTWVDGLRAKSRHGEQASLEQLSEAGRDPESEETMVDSADVRNLPSLLDGFSDKTIILALKQLPDDMCWTLLLVDVTGLSYELAASVMNVPVGTVRSRVSRARDMLRKRLLMRPEDISILNR